MNDIEIYQSVPNRVYPCPVGDDPVYRLALRAEDDENFMNVLYDLQLGQLSRKAGMEFLNSDGPFYRDSRPQAFIIADEAAVTLAATDKLMTAGARTALVANYLTIGKRLKVEYFGRFTTALTPGNIGAEIYYGTTDAGGTLLASSGAVALTASKTNITFRAEAYLSVRAIGASGSVIAFGQFSSDPAGALLTNNFLLVPASAAAAVTVDTTAAQGFNMQIKRSGSTVETLQIHDMLFEALN